MELLFKYNVMLDVYVLLVRMWCVCLCALSFIFRTMQYNYNIQVNYTESSPIMFDHSWPFYCWLMPMVMSMTMRDVKKAHNAPRVRASQRHENSTALLYCEEIITPIIHLIGHTIT